MANQVRFYCGCRIVDVKILRQDSSGVVIEEMLYFEGHCLELKQFGDIRLFSNERGDPGTELHLYGINLPQRAAA